VDGDVVVEKDVILRAAPDRLPRSAWVSLKIYNILGQEVKDLVKGLQPEGVHRLSWDGRGNNREKVRSGVYFCVLQIKKSRFAGRMVLIR
jgi:flagellar hook assembly protein FlgD